VAFASALGASFLAGSLFAGFFSSFLTSALAGAGALAVAAGAAGLDSSFLAGACANADTANNDAITSAIDFILKFPLGYTQRIFPAYIYNALVDNYVDNQFRQKKGHLSARSNRVN